MFMVHYPYPKDRRVLVGLRTWEFVYDDPAKDDGSVIPAPSNMLYVHHLAGSGKDMLLWSHVFLH